MMNINHSPSSLRRFTDEPLGFFTTAECFVFIAAFLAGMLFRKRAEKLGLAAARSFTIRRAWRRQTLATKYRISLPETRMREHPSPSRTVRQRVLQAL
jgi:hypothetical protein